MRLLRPDELPGGWDPDTDCRVTVWEATHRPLRLYYHEKRGDVNTAALLRQLGSGANWPAISPLPPTL